MCGIAGCGGPGTGPNVDPQLIRRMCNTLRHRGPDDEGYLAINTHKRTAIPLIGTDSRVTGETITQFNQTANFFLGHRRLSILDISPAGHQPMSYENQKLWIIFNGEIYNYLELRETLKNLGHTFQTGTDTEVLIAAYRQWEEKCLQYLDGMWSFVIYDKNKNCLFGARDRFGVKPFYYFKIPGFFAFASEIKALVTLPCIQKKLNPEAVFDFLVLGGIHFLEEGFFKGIFELQPSHAMRYDLSSDKQDIWKYYTLPYTDKWEPFNPKKSRDNIQKTNELILNAIGLRLRSDVPLGSALSGGIDSSSIVCSINRILTQEQAAKDVTPQSVFTASFPGKTIDESVWAKRIANHVQAKHYLVTPTSDEYLHDLEDIAYYQDTPYSSPSVYAQYRVMRSAKENNITVVLDGQGADELFTGYTSYYGVFFAQLIKHFNLKTFLREIKHLENSPLSRRDVYIDLFKQLRREILPYSLIKKYRTKQKPPFHFLDISFWEKYKNRFDLIQVRDFKSVNSMLFEYIGRQKLGNLLKYEDRNSMRYSIESRTPFADYIHLIEYVFSLPEVYKIHDGWSKYLLREAMKDILPEEIRLRTDKKGFFTPDLLWLQEQSTHLKHYLGDEIAEFVNLPMLKEILNQVNQPGLKMSVNQIQLLWRLIGLAVWRRVYSI